jgi:uncharacterized protein (DUF2147 family)
MLRKVCRIIAVLASMAPAVASAGEAVHGVWMRDGHAEKLEFFDCEGKLCARGVIPPPDGSEPPLILRHAPKIAPNQWKGELFNPQNGKLYTGTITFNEPDKLTLTGCLIAFLCQSETWTRVVVVPPPKTTPVKPPATRK